MEALCQAELRARDGPRWYQRGRSAQPLVSFGTAHGGAPRAAARDGVVTLTLRVSALWERLRGSLWFIPAVAVLLALVAGTVLATWPPTVGAVLEPLAFDGTAPGARTLLTAIAGAMITVTALTFTLTVVALQMASSQYSPRVLRGFLADRSSQIVLALFLATFAYAIAVLRVIREEGPATTEVVPQLAVGLGALLTLLSVGALVYFIHHLTQQLRLETILDEIVRETLGAIDDAYDDRSALTTTSLPEPPSTAHRVWSHHTGYLQAVRPGGLADAAEAAEVTVRLRPTLGAHVTRGTTLGWVWPTGDAELPDEEELVRLVHGHVHLGSERTGRRDVAFGMRQLVDIAVRALSPGVNDPTTAVVVAEALAPPLCALTDVRSGSEIVSDEDGTVRAIVPRPSFGDLLELACGQIRRYGAGEPAVLAALADLLADIGECASTDDQRTAIGTQIDRLETTVDGSVEEPDRRPLRRAVAVARVTLEDERPAEPDVPAG